MLKLIIFFLKTRYTFAKQVLSIKLSRRIFFYICTLGAYVFLLSLGQANAFSYSHKNTKKISYYFNFNHQVYFSSKLLSKPNRLVIDFTSKQPMLSGICKKIQFKKINIASTVSCSRRSKNKIQLKIILLKALSASQYSINYVDFPKRRVRLVLPTYVKDYKKYNNLQVGSKKTVHSKKTVYLKKAVPPKKTLPNKKLIAKNALPNKKLIAKKTTVRSGVSASKKHKIIKTKSLPAAKKYLMVVVDPGHGGNDPGATGADNTHEKTVVFQISRRLKRMINAVPGFAAVLTRNGDYYLTLRQRLAIARKRKANMFVAIHADAFSNHTAHGVSVFALSLRGATSEAARWLAHNENRSESLGNVQLHDKNKTLRSVLLDLSQNATISTSIKIGRQIIANVKTYAHLHHPNVEQAAFVVLKAPDIPSLLVESGFLSNPQEELRLKSPHYQNLVATSISQGIIQYFIAHPPQGTKLKFWRSQGKTLYKIKKQDSFKKIALRMHTTAHRIIKLNKNLRHLSKVGSYIFIPTLK